MYSLFFIFILYHVTVLPFLTQADEKYKICVVSNYNGNDKTKTHCPALSRQINSEVECEFANDRTHCIRKMLAGDADFGVFQPEEISYASQWNDFLSVTNEIRLSENEDFDYSMVVLVNEESNIRSLNDLRGKRLCHPGFAEGVAGNGRSNSILQYFEKTIVPQKCNSEMSIIENQVQSLSEFFGESCKAGQWDPNPDVDYTLKTKYPKLCALCKNPLACSSNDRFWGRQGALLCLSDCFGDISWARLSDVRLHFNGDGINTCSQISFLCPDGSLQPLNATNPCTWISRPWPAIVARKSAATSIQKMINYSNNAKELKNTSSWQWSLNNLLIHYFEPITSNVIKSPKEYLSEFPGYFNSESENNKCTSRTFSMCTENSDAFKKCQTLSDIAVTYGIEPNMNCRQASECGQELENGESDVMILDADRMASYKRMYHTKKTVLYATSLYHRMYRKVSAVMLKKKAVKSLEQLRGKIGCFPLFDGFVWNSFLITSKLEKLDLSPNNSTIKHFFSNSCAIISSDQNAVPSCQYDDIFPEESNKKGLLWETLALRCIIEGGGDVAFVNTHHIDNYLGILKTPMNLQDNFSALNFTTVCGSNYSRSPVDCPLSWSHFGQIIVNPNLSPLVEYEIISVLLTMDATFGRKSEFADTLPPVFLMYGPHDNVADPLFPVDTEKLETVSQLSEHQVPIIPEYETHLLLLNQYNDVPKSSSNLMISQYPLLSLLNYLSIFIFILH
ncbi:transferrin-like [Adelges cooleyi]|uniref:transferrin-like n=1 Tax=Adelges cooleyi TaxID=133065 RepID=UPI00218009A4|nr:transferrin-like [Adelges cooleyi]